MHRLLALALLLLAPPCLANSDADSVNADLDAKVRAWRRDFHQHPELGNREFRTAKIVAAHLRALGMEVKTGVAHTGVVAILRGGRPGPRIALRADMDALPVTEQTGLPFASTVTTNYNGETVGVMHACGHDAHTAILMGVAEALAARRAQLPGEVLFVFQPAEEGPPAGETGGAAQVLAEGLFDHFQPEAMFGLHADSTLHAGEIGLRGGPLQAAADSFRIVVKGRQTHGARPWMGIDPIIVAADIVGDAQSIVSRRLNLSLQPAVLSFGAIRGGLRNNIIPEEVELIGTIRSFDPTMRQQMIDALHRIAEHAAAAHGASVEAQIPDAPGYPVLVNDAALVERIRPGLQRALGAENVKAVPLYTSSEDFAEYARRVPSVFLRLGVVPAGQDPASAPTNHSPRFDLDEAALKTGVRALLRICLDYLGAEASVKS
jgi:amidohydrolase